jgi:hypothetical protein
LINAGIAPVWSGFGDFNPFDNLENYLWHYSVTGRANGGSIADGHATRGGNAGWYCRLLSRKLATGDYFEKNSRHKMLPVKLCNDQLYSDMVMGHTAL